MKAAFSQQGIPVPAKLELYINDESYLSCMIRVEGGLIVIALNHLHYKKVLPMFLRSLFSFIPVFTKMLVMPQPTIDIPLSCIAECIANVRRTQPNRLGLISELFLDGVTMSERDFYDFFSYFPDVRELFLTGVKGLSSSDIVVGLLQSSRSVFVIHKPALLPLLQQVTFKDMQVSKEDQGMLRLFSIKCNVI